MWDLQTTIATADGLLDFKARHDALAGKNKGNAKIIRTVGKKVKKIRHKGVIKERANQWLNEKLLLRLKSYQIVHRGVTYAMSRFVPKATLRRRNLMPYFLRSLLPIPLPR